MARWYSSFGWSIAFSLSLSLGGIGAASVCQRIEATLPGRIHWRESELYDAAQGLYYSGQEQEIQPRCIFTPIDTGEVSRFMMILIADVESNVPHVYPQFAIRSGGHSVFPGAANIDDGITVDLRRMNKVVLSQDMEEVSIGAGGIWSEIYPQIEAQNLTVAGGRVAGVGVGGYLTGGGISYLSRRHGWACDTVIGYEVVLADGKIVYANADSHRDLWLALKGGSNNFGIVTRFDMRTFPMSDMWGGTIMFAYDKPALDAQASALSDFMRPENFDDAASLFVALFYLEGMWAAGNVLFYVEPVEDPPAFRNFTKKPNQLHNTLRLTKVSDVATEQPSRLPPEANRAINIVCSFRSPTAAIYSELFQAWEDGVKALSDVKGLQISLLIQPHPVSNGTNSLGLPPGGEEFVMSVITTSYARKSDDNKMQKGVEAIIEKQIEILKGAGVYISFQYLNYADRTSQNAVKSYGKEKGRFLRETSIKYDPKGLFQQAVPGGFKLFDQEELLAHTAQSERDEL